jgi:predicted DsbA family dithiol-disulfide isomerase
MRLLFYLDVLSLWCAYAEESLQELLPAWEGRLAFDWRIALIRGREPLGYRREEQAWFYRRAAYVTGKALNPTWLAGPETGTLYANLACEAARRLGHGGHEVRRALMRAAMVDGQPTAEAEVAAAVAAAASGLGVDEVLAAMADPGTLDRVEATTAELASLGARLRPAFLVENDIGDRVLLSGVWSPAPIEAALAALAADEERYRTFPEPPP